jgi:hypothetical protein
VSVIAGGALVHRPFHGQQRGLEDIDLFDFPWSGDANADQRSVLLKNIEECFSPAGGQQFGIFKQRILAVTGQNHTGGYHRTCKGPPPGFIDPGDARITPAIQTTFKMEGISWIE